MTGRRRLLILFLVSLVLRLGAVGVMVAVDARPAFDEQHYVQRAEGWASWLGLSDRTPRATAFDRAFDDGFQPPLHPMLMGAVTGGGRLPLSGRVWNALLGALATPLVFVFARRFVGSREAQTAAWFHAGFPTSLFFAASLWAEPLYIAALLGALIAVTTDKPRPWLGGLALGALLLTRTAALPYLLVIPWLAGRHAPARWKAMLTVAIVAIVVVSPWQAVLLHETDGFPMLSTSGGWNLALGNAPDVRLGEGSLWVGPDDHERLAEAIATAGGAYPYVVDRVTDDPVAAVGRALDRLRLTWAADLFPTRHAAHLIHRPLPVWAAAGRWAGQTLLWLAILSFIVQGFLRPDVVRRRGLLLVLVFVGCLGPLLTVGFPRLHHPLLILLLPVAGAGWVHRRDGLSLNRQLIAAGVMGAMAWLTTSSWPAVIETQMLPSAWSRPWIEPVARVADAHPVYADQVLIRTRSSSDGVVWMEPSPGNRIQRGPGAWQQLLTVHAGRAHAVRPLVLGMTGSGDVVIDPLDASWWRKWRSLADHGLPDLELMWLGGGIADRRDVVGRGDSQCPETH